MISQEVHREPQYSAWEQCTENIYQLKISTVTQIELENKTPCVLFLIPCTIGLIWEAV